MYWNPMKTHVLESHENSVAQRQEFEAYMLAWAKEKGLGIWGFKREEDNPQDDGKS